MGDELTKTIWLLLLLVGPLALFLFRRSIAKAIAPARSRANVAWENLVVRCLPRWLVWRFCSGLKGKCPTCGNVVAFAEIETGATAFRCPHCGEQGTWLGDEKK